MTIITFPPMTSGVFVTIKKTLVNSVTMTDVCINTFQFMAESSGGALQVVQSGKVPSKPKRLKKPRLELTREQRRTNYTGNPHAYTCIDIHNVTIYIHTHISYIYMRVYVFVYNIHI